MSAAQKWGTSSGLLAFCKWERGLLLGGSSERTSFTEDIWDKQLAGDGSPSTQALQGEVGPHAQHPKCWSKAGQTSCCSRWLQRKPSNFSSLNEVWQVDIEYNYYLALPPSGNPSFPSDGVFMLKSFTLVHSPVLRKLREHRTGPNASLTQQHLLQTSFPRTHTSVLLRWQMRS